MRTLLAAVALATLAMSAFSGCTHEKKVNVGNINPDKMPMMRTENVNTLISDSGIVQYKIVSPLWLVFDTPDTAYWHFPKGLYLQKYDRFFNVIATVACDSAYYFKNMRTWRLDGHVEVTQSPASLFQTAQLFWDERQHRLFTDSFIHIENTTHIIEGEGFTSNDKLTDYRIIRPTGIFPTDGALNGSAGPGASQPDANTQNASVAPATEA